MLASAEGNHRVPWRIRKSMSEANFLDLDGVILMGSEVQSPKLIFEVLQWILSILLAVVLALVIREFIFEPVMVDGSSMDDTLHDRQRLFEYKLGYRFSPPQRGDIVVIQIKEGKIKYLPIPDSTEIDYIKRVIGLPGEEVDLKDGSVYINGEKLTEPYAKGITYKKDMQFPATVPEGKVFVLGDNREGSSDSRESHIGFIDISKIRGKAVFRVWPIKDIGKLE